MGLALLTSLYGSVQADTAGTPPSSTTVSVSLPAGPLMVQVNQVALERLGPKSAVVEYRGEMDQGSYRVTRLGRVVSSGPLRLLPAFDAWGNGRHYFELDFSSVRTAGRHRIEVQIGALKASSPYFEIQDRALFKVTAARLLDYFRKSRHLNNQDRRIRIFETERYVDVWGGWRDAGGDTGKYLSHLGYANHFNPQQASMAAWTLAYTAHTAAPLYRQAGLLQRAVSEAFWGADYLHRILDADGYFYTTVFDKWGDAKAERMVVGYEGEDGRYTKQYRSAYRAGAGMAIAALARASMLAKQTRGHGVFSADTYLTDAERAFAHLQEANLSYCADGKENIIDDYTALMAAVELHRATRRDSYLEQARLRAEQLMQRQAVDGSFMSDGGQRPYYHAVEAGLPVISLAHYLEVEPDSVRAHRARAAISSSLQHQLRLDQQVSNPYAYARQEFRLFRDGKLAEQTRAGFFIPHQNETGYWWQGESARLASLSVAAVLGGRHTEPLASGNFGTTERLAAFAQHQIDWTLGRNPYGISMLYGFGARNPPTVQESAGDMFVGGVSNGITGAADSDSGEGIAFAPGPDDSQWRWVEQWIPHSTWMLLAAVTLSRP
nr:glycoside hydrolase family 9 protein [uncultured Roseateles sp.]